jgi:hypothetical protein
VDEVGKVRSLLGQAVCSMALTNCGYLQNVQQKVFTLHCSTHRLYARCQVMKRKLVLQGHGTVVVRQGLRGCITTMIKRCKPSPSVNIIPN